MNELGDTTEDELDPKVPLPGEPLLDHAAEQRADGRAADRGQDDIGHSEALVIGLPHISRHSQSHRTTGRAQTTEESADDDGAKVGGQGTGDLPDVDEEQTELHDGPASKLLTPGSPELATEGVCHQEDHLAYTRCLLTDMEHFGQRGDGIGIDATVEVHGHLHGEDDGQDGPFLIPGKREAEFVVAFVLEQFPLAISPGLSSRAAVIVIGGHGMFGMKALGLSIVEAVLVGTVVLVLGVFLFGMGYGGSHIGCTSAWIENVSMQSIREGPEIAG